jgi:hypothetical protein
MPVPDDERVSCNSESLFAEEYPETTSFALGELVPIPTLPLESSVMLFVALVGWVTLMVFNVLMAASY